MKAAQLQAYNKSATLFVNDVEIPNISHDEVLIKVKSAAVNPLENLIASGSLKLMNHYTLPVTLGNEIAGEIVKVGKNVLDFNVGNFIYSRLPATTMGGFAEYIAVKSAAIGMLPKNLDFKSGASAPLGALTAYQILYEELSVQAGQSIFIPGISGSFGQMALPIAKSLGLTVYGSGNSRDRERLLELGVDKYLDYKTENYWETLTDVDFVIDTLGPREYSNELSIIKPGGKIVSLIDGPNKLFAVTHHFSFWKTFLFSIAGMKFDKQAKAKNIQYRFIFVRSDGNQLEDITKIIETNNIVPIYDQKSFTIDEINKAITYMNSGKAHGKVLINFE